VEANPDHQDQPETMDNQERAELQEAQAMQEDLQFKHVSNLPLHHAHLALLARRDLPDNQAHPETQDQTEIQDKAVAIPNPDRLDQKDHQDHQDQMDSQARQDNPVNQLNRKKQDQASQDLWEMLDHRDHQDQLVSQDNPEDQVNQDRRDPMANPAPLEMMGSPVIQERAEHQEVQVRKVSVRNTAPSMVESSSKMEHEDVKSRPSTQRTRGDLPKTPCPMNQQFPFLLLVAQKTAIYYVSLLYCAQEWGSIFGLFHPLFFLK